MDRGGLFVAVLLVAPAALQADFLFGHVSEMDSPGAGGVWTGGGDVPLGEVWGRDGVRRVDPWGGKSRRQRIDEGIKLVRHARTIVYPNNGVYKFIIGLGIPVPLRNKLLALGVNFQFQYATPTNATQLAWPVVVRGRHNRAAIYGSIEAAIDRRGLSGRSCLLRAICEAAETPLLYEGLLGELLHLLLTPSLGHAPVELLEEYRRAEEAGEAAAEGEGPDCADLFPSCPFGSGILDHVTRVRPQREDEEDLPRALPPHWDAIVAPDAPARNRTKRTQ